MIKLFSVKVRPSIIFCLNDQWLPVCDLCQEKQKKDAAAGKGIKQSAGELRLQKGHEFVVVMTGCCERKNTFS